MDEEQLDNNLRNRIKEVFDNYEDTSADEGWQQLRKKYPAGGRIVPSWMWGAAAAAAVLLFLGVGFWIYDTRKQPEQLSAVKTAKHQPDENIAARQPNGKDSQPATVAAGTKPADKTMSANLQANTVAQATHISAPTTTASRTVNGASGLRANAAKGINAAVPAYGVNNKHSYQQPNLAPVNSIARQPMVKLTPLPKIALSDTVTSKKLMAKTTGTGKTMINKAPGPQLALDVKPVLTHPDTMKVIHQPAAHSIGDMFAQDKQLNGNKNNEKNKTDEKRVHFGLYAATYFNYAKGSDNTVNVGGGFTSDIRISKNLKLVTGVSIGQNTLSYAGNAQVNPQESNLVLAGTNTPAASRGGIAGPAVALYSTVPATSSVSYLSNNYKSYNASLIGLDIPLNLKFNFNPQKSDTYISAGVSSGTFINEAYTYQYSTPSLFSSVPQTTAQTSTKNFDSFYFAKTLNVAFGIGYPLGKNHVVIEPFLKYPLQGLGSQDIRFGAGGINLKFNFWGK